MFERYTEKARRTIFFARYEASQLGSPNITPEHLLLGILRESREVQRHLNVDMSRLSERLSSPASGPKISTSVDLPLDDAARRCLAHAAEEADGMGHRNIGPEHLLIGIMRERTRGAEVLREMGAPSVEEVRRQVRESELRESATPAPVTGGPWPPTLTLIEEGERELTGRLRLPGVPSVGQAILLTTDGVDENYRVVDVAWQFDVTPESEAVFTGVEVRIRKENNAKKR